jgi:TolA-binding protein
VLNLKARGLMMDTSRWEDGLQTVRDLVQRYGASTAQNVRREVSIALMMQAVALAALGRRDEAKATFRRAEVDFGDALPAHVADEALRALQHSGVPITRP